MSRKKGPRPDGRTGSAMRSIGTRVPFRTAYASWRMLAALARAADPGSRTRRKPSARQVRPSVARVLELMTDIPAFVGTAAVTSSPPTR